GGLLETNNQLERFTKNKKSKKLTYSIIGILLIIGSITLFKTYAFFEEKREFNVLKGRVPEFSHEDIQLAFTINGEKGEKFPTINDGLVAQNVTCSNGATANWSNTLWALTNINSNGNKKVYCSVDFITSQKINLYDNVNIGDYISYTPVLSNYEITSQATGYTSNQTINPSELKLWRVIRKNNDGSIDLVSKYTSTSRVGFDGEIGYKNYVGTLNRIANSYETPGITRGSRYMGYDGQTEYISIFGTGGFISESEGGGDELYQNDVSLVETACGNLIAGSTGDEGYWLASRKYIYNGRDGSWKRMVYYVRGSGSGSNYTSTVKYTDDWFNYTTSYGAPFSRARLRPIVILKSGIVASSGDGSENNPWKVN
ncbi:MAG: hypothetical protein HFJ02_06305, partial [Bacilli bacterium]|nr:hypothetical protein [Bacilli bacterium]